MTSPTSPTATSTASATSPQQRELNFACFNCLLGDLEKICAGPVQTTGNWTAGMIVQHIADSINRSIDAFDIEAPFLLRMVGPLIRKRAINNRMKPGIEIPKKFEIILPDSSATLEDAAANLRAAIERTKREKMTARHPVFGQLTPEEWLKLHLRHAEMHFGFIQPE